jgi:hypothetical protein
MHWNSKLIALTMIASAACRPDLTVGAWSCDPSDANVVPDVTASVELPWSTGFESEFCDYEQAGGFCYAGGLANYETVTAPVHSGRYAAAFRVQAGSDGFQTRCVRQGVMPTSAYYGAWYFIPERARATANWNLVHIRGGEPSQQHGLWDISLMNRGDGSLEAFVYDHLHTTARQASNAPAIPIAKWFHLELYLRRSAQPTGEVALYQDGQMLLTATNLVTDDTSWGQWYVGNLAMGLTPADSVVYVDDVTVRSVR